MHQEPARTAPRIVALMGSYRAGGTIETAVEEILAGARARGATTECLRLVDLDIEFCRNCRACTQEPGSERAQCVLEDEMDMALRALEAADAIVLAAPVNFGDVNALTRRFLERMIGCTHWPWDAKCPVPRNQRRDKPAILLTSSASPGLLTRLCARPLRTLRQMARLLGAKPLVTEVIGLAGGDVLSRSERQRARSWALGGKLVEAIRPRERERGVDGIAIGPEHEHG